MNAHYWMQIFTGFCRRTTCTGTKYHSNGANFLFLLDFSSRSMQHAHVLRMFACVCFVVFDGFLLGWIHIRHMFVCSPVLCAKHSQVFFFTWTNQRSEFFFELHEVGSIYVDMYVHTLVHECVALRVFLSACVRVCMAWKEFHLRINFN